MKRLLQCVVFASVLAVHAAGQTAAPAGPQGGETQGRPREGRMMFGGGNMGTITAIDGGTLMIKTVEGKAITIKTSDTTRFVGPNFTPLSLKDLKVGDTIMAGGQPDSGGVVDARVVGKLDPQMAQRMEEQRAAMGKTIVAGEIKEINDTKLTILRPDGQTQTIELDENSSLKRFRESITMADIKVGDRIYATGELKDGVFMVKELRAGGGGQMRMRMDRGEGRTEQPKTDQPK